MQRQAVSLTALQEVDRVSVLIGIFVFVCCFVVIRLFIVQVVEHSFYAALASGQHELVQQLTPDRGEIYAKDKYAPDGITVIATNRQLAHVYANPKQITDPQKTTDIVAPILGLDPEIVLARVSKGDDLYEPLKDRVSDQEVAALEAAIDEQKLTGIHWSPVESRYYPEGEYASSVTGFVGLVDEVRVGQYGLEQEFNDELTGEVGSVKTKRDPSGRLIATGENSIVPAQDGDMLITTIDKNVQYKSCTLIAQAVEKYQADSGTIIVMNPKTGAIMSMCNAPLYDPNAYNEVEDISVFSNDAVSGAWEPGSVFKAITMSAGLNDKVVTPYTTYEDTGEVEIGPYTIHNSDGKANGVVDMTKVLEDSLNTGTIYVALRLLGNQRWRQYVEDFHFGEYTGIRLAGESAGTIDGVTQEKDIYTATSSYGQGLAVTPVQLLQAFSALANDGAMMKPYIIERIVKPNGYQEEFQPEVVGRPITPETAQTVSAMLVRVVEGGHAIMAEVPGYHFAGKTGTAQVIRDDGNGYDVSQHKDTFVAYGPVSDPQILVLVKLDKPKGVQWAATSVAPIFGELGQYLVNYLQIPPDEPVEQQ